MKRIGRGCSNGRQPRSALDRKTNQLTVKQMSQLTKIITICAIIAVLAAGVAVKWFFFPSAKDDYFAMNQRSFRQVPSGIVVVRQTHFPKSMRKGIMSDSIQVSGHRVWRMMGRNVTLQQLMGVAYGRSADRVVLPAIVSDTNYDFLVTARGNMEETLQAAIRKRLGFVAHAEMRDTDALALKVQDTSLPGLAVSDAGAKQDVNFDNGKLYFTHTRLKMMTDGLEQMLKKPIIDKTNLTNFYDFSVTWDSQMQRQLQNDSTAAAAVKKILAGWGLGLEPDNDLVEMLVVKSAS